MSVAVKHRRDSRTNCEANTPLAGELWFDSTLLALRIGDAAQAGGYLSKKWGLDYTVSPAQITSNQNDYNPTDLAIAERLLLNSDAARSITGIAGGATNRTLEVVNKGSFNITLSDASGSSSAGNRFSFGGDVVLRPKQGITLAYDAAASRWIAGADALAFKGVTDLPENVTRSGDLTPSQITSNQNDYNPTSLATASVLRLSTDALRNITGIAGGADGRELEIHNVGSFSIMFKNADSGSTAGNRFDIGADITLTAKQVIKLWYDSTDSRWKMVSNTAGSAVADAAVTAVKLGTTALGLLPMINGTIVESHSGNAATFALKTLAGTDPTAADPVHFVFRTVAGGYTVRTVTAALSVTVSSGSSLGFTNAIAGRVHITAWDTGSAAVLGVYNATGSGPSVAIVNEWVAVNSTAEGGAGAADSAQTHYTAAAQTGKFCRLIAFADYESGLVAAGTWVVAPDRIVLHGPGVARPGDVTQRSPIATSSGSTSTAGTSYVSSGLTVPFNLISACNLVRGRAIGTLRASTQAFRSFARLARASNSNMFGPELGVLSITGSITECAAALDGLDKPNTTSGLSYYTMIKTETGGTAVWDDGKQAEMYLEEIMA